MSDNKILMLSKRGSVNTSENKVDMLSNNLRFNKSVLFKDLNRSNYISQKLFSATEREKNSMTRKRSTNEV